MQCEQNIAAYNARLWINTLAVTELWASRFLLKKVFRKILLEINSAD